MRKIEPLPKIETGPVNGEMGDLAILSINALRVDETYQRSMSAKSKKNVAYICKNFSWIKFTPIIVVEIPGNLFAVIDGQHRATAAMTLSISEIPCCVMKCTPEQAAAAFAAINGRVTSISPADIWHAEVAAKDPDAMAVKRVLDAADVTIIRKNISRYDIKVGQSRSINVIRRAFEKHGPDLLTTALQCITQTGNGNPGFISGAVINGIINAIRTKKELLGNPSRLFDIFDMIDLEELVEKARVITKNTGNPVQFSLTRMINEKLRASEGA